MKMNNIVYWLTYKEYATPQSLNWTNDLYIIYDDDFKFEENMQMVLDNIKKEKPLRYVLVIDTKDKNEKVLVKKNFISNNVLEVNDNYDISKFKNQIEWILSDYGKSDLMDNSNVWFTSDQHFFHNNIIKYCNRPWNSGKDNDGNLIVSDDDVIRMNEALIQDWNSVVAKDDIVWMLGDFCLGKNQNENIPKLVNSLNGKINLVLGNHDYHPLKFYYDAGFNRVYDRPVIVNSFVVLSHSPLEFVKAPFFNVFGHVHTCETYNTWSKDSCCVCVERHDYKPVSYQTILEHYEELNGI